MATARDSVQTHGMVQQHSMIPSRVHWWGDPNLEHTHTHPPPSPGLLGCLLGCASATPTHPPLDVSHTDMLSYMSSLAFYSPNTAAAAVQPRPGTAQQGAPCLPLLHLLACTLLAAAAALGQTAAEGHTMLPCCCCCCGGCLAAAGLLAVTAALLPAPQPPAVPP